MPVEVGRGYGHELRRGRLLSAELVDDGDVAPDGKRVVNEVLRLLQVFPFDELVMAPRTILAIESVRPTMS